MPRNWARLRGRLEHAYRLRCVAATSNGGCWTSRWHGAKPLRVAIEHVERALLLFVAAMTMGVAPAALAQPASERGVCAYSVPATRAFDLPLWRGGAPVVSEQGDAAPAPCTDSVITALRAREHARARAAALLDTYEVLLDASAFTVDGDSLHLGELAVPIPEAMEIGGQWLALSSTEPLRFDVDPFVGEDVLTRHAMGAVSLRLVYTLAARSAPEGSICGATPDGISVVFGELVEAELVEALTGASRGRAVTASYVDAQVRALAAERSGAQARPRPIAEVTAMELTGTQGCSEEESSVIQSVLETLAAECYVLGLRENSRLGGALVLRFDIDPAGWIATYELVTDALLSAGVTECLEETVRQVRLREPPTSDGLQVRATVVFRDAPSD